MSERTARAQAFGQHLIEIHDYFRNSLRQLRTAAASLQDGTVVDVVSVRGDLRQHCLYFCGGLHRHHTIEDSAMFPQLRLAVPELAPVLDRLESDHVRVANYITQIEKIAEKLPTADGDAIPRLREELDRLSEDLLAHLAYEEEQLVPLLDAAS